MTVAADGIWPFVVLAGGAAATYAWRFVGVLLSGRIRADSAVFDWIACVAYALLAGLVARMILLPSGPLVETRLVDRMLAATLGLVVFFFATRRNLPAAVLAAAGTMGALAWLDA